MALLFMDGFDHYATADIAKKWTFGGGSIGASSGRRSTGALTGTNVLAGKTLSSNYATLIVGMAVNPAFSNITLFTFTDAGNAQCTVFLDGSNRVVLYRGTSGGTVLGTSTETLSTSQFSYLEVKLTVSDTAGAYEIKKDGASILTGSSANTRSTSNNYSNSVTIGASGSSLTIDDMYICDTSGSTNNDFLGDVRIDTVYPDADGNYTDWTLSTGTDHYALVDETAPNTSDYVYSNTANEMDSYTFGNVTVLSALVYAVQANCAANKDDSGLRSIALFARSGTTDGVGSTQFLSANQFYKSQIFETDPNTSAAWTEANFNSAEFGIKLVS